MKLGPYHNPSKIMKLRPYHNPLNIDTTAIPEGWRMLYEDEFPLPRNNKTPCRMFVFPHYLGNDTLCLGNSRFFTYIIPVKS